MNIYNYELFLQDTKDVKKFAESREDPYMYICEGTYMELTIHCICYPYTHD